MVKNRNEISLELSNVQDEGREENYFGDSSSVCSEEASNYPEEELVNHLKATLKRRRRNSSNKHQVTRDHKFLKKKTKLDKKITRLQQLMPNSTDVDNNNACVLDEAIVYIKFLQNQIQFISSASALAAGMYTSMLQTLQQPNMMNQFHASYLVQNDFCSSLPSFVGSRMQMPHAGMTFQHPSIMSNLCVPFSPYGSLMPFQSM